MRGRAKGSLTLPANAADFVPRFASINLAGTPAYETILEPVARKVEEASGNRIQVALKPLGVYGKPADLFDMTERGDIEIAVTVQGYNPGRFPRSTVMELPLMYDTATSGTEAKWKLFKEELIDQDYTSVRATGRRALRQRGGLRTVGPDRIAAVGPSVMRRWSAAPPVVRNDRRGNRPAAPVVQASASASRGTDYAWPSNRSEMAARRRCGSA